MFIRSNIRKLPVTTSAYPQIRILPPAVCHCLGFCDIECIFLPWVLWTLEGRAKLQRPGRRKNWVSLNAANHRTSIPKTSCTLWHHCTLRISPKTNTPYAIPAMHRMSQCTACVSPQISKKYIPTDHHKQIRKLYVNVQMTIF